MTESQSVRLADDPASRTAAEVLGELGAAYAQPVATGVRVDLLHGESPVEYAQHLGA